MDTAISVKKEQAQSDRILDLEEEVAQLRDALGSTLGPPLWLRLTLREGQLLGMLLARQVVTHEMAYLGMYGGDLDPPDQKIFTIYIFKLRRKLRPHDLFIETVWGRGWRLDDENRERLRALYKQDSDKRLALLTAI